MTYIEDGMKQIIPDTQQARHKAASSSATAADQKVLDSLPAKDRELVMEVMENHPGLSAEKALAMLNAAGM
jgi:hypothetical protein